MRLRLLFIDNYDSFTYNIVHALQAAGAEPEVILNDDPRLRAAAVLERYDALTIGPGPGHPEELKGLHAIFQRAADNRLPIFGVCLGMQFLVEVFGGAVVRAPAIMHGKRSRISHDGTGLFLGIPSPFLNMRYHSLCADDVRFPSELRVTARSDDGVIQAIAHKTLPICGVQFHPESIASEHGSLLFKNAVRLCRPQALSQVAT